MARKLGIFFVICVGMAALGLTGCASVDSIPEGEEFTDVRLNIIDKRRISELAPIKSFNPYIPPADLLVVTTKEFIVLELSIISNVPVQIEYGFVRAVSVNGVNLATFMDKPALVEYWRDLGTLEEFDKQKEVLERTYLPFLSFERKAGKRSYIMVLTGKRPILRPFSVNSAFYINGKIYEFSIPVTE